MKSFFRSFFSIRLSRTFYLIMGGFILIFTAGFLFPFIYSAGIVLLSCWILFLLSDIYFLFRHSAPLSASRFFPYRKLSNGDENSFQVIIQNLCSTKWNVVFLEDFPAPLQIRDKVWKFELPPHGFHSVHYTVLPVQRGEYVFGNLNFLLQRKYGVLRRYYGVNATKKIKCYPSFIRLRHFEFLAIHNRFHEIGIKRIRKVGHSTEFEQIKEYVRGDDVRVINWKATARMNRLMINHFADERSQPIYSILDMGRTMYMPFRSRGSNKGMTLLDYSINACLIFSHVARVKSDKPGLIGFEKNISFHIPCSSKPGQLALIQEQLYNAQTGFEESSLFHLYRHIRKNITQRSLLILFTNIEYHITLERKIRYLKRIQKFHRLVVVIFKNTELHSLLHSPPRNTFEIYKKAIALQFENQKKKILYELSRNGILSIYTEPENLTVQVINKYLEIKERNLL